MRVGNLLCCQSIRYALRWAALELFNNKASVDGEAYLCGLEMSDLLNQSNAHSLEKELVWFNAVLDARIALYFEHESEEEVESSLAQSIYDIAAPNLSDDASLYSDLVRELSLSIDERLIFLMALIPHIRPDLLDILFTRNKNFDRGFTQFGGLKGKTTEVFYLHVRQPSFCWPAVI